MAISDVLTIGFYILLISIAIVLTIIAFRYYKSWLRSVVEPFLQILLLISLSATILLIITIIGITTSNESYHLLHLIQLIITGSIIGLSVFMSIIVDRWSKRISTINNKDESIPSSILYLNLLGQAFKGEAGYMAAYYLGRSLAEQIQRSQRSIKSITKSFSMLTGIIQIAPEDLRNETIIIIDSQYVTDKFTADLITHFARGYWESVITKIRNKETRCSVKQLFTNNHFEIHIKPLKSNEKIENLNY